MGIESFPLVGRHREGRNEVHNYILQKHTLQKPGLEAPFLCNKQMYLLTTTAVLQLQFTFLFGAPAVLFPYVLSEMVYHLYNGGVLNSLGCFFFFKSSSLINLSVPIAINSM